MKTKIILISLLILLIPLYAIAEINPFNGEIHGNFEVGTDVKNKDSFTSLGIEYHFNIWKFKNIAYGSITTGLIFTGFSNYPYSTTYEVGNKVIYNNFYIDFNALCRHSTYSYYNRLWWNENLENQKTIRTISIGIEW